MGPGVGRAQSGQNCSKSGGWGRRGEMLRIECVRHSAGSNSRSRALEAQNSTSKCATVRETPASARTGVNCSRAVWGLSASGTPRGPVVQQNGVSGAATLATEVSHGELSSKHGSVCSEAGCSRSIWDCNINEDSHGGAVRRWGLVRQYRQAIGRVGSLES